MTKISDFAQTLCFAAILGLAALTPWGEARATVTFTVLHVFNGGSIDGAVPNSTLVVDGSGNLYGTTTFGGTKNNGTIFKVSAGRLVTLYSFQGGTDGAFPQGPIAIDGSGNVFGTTSAGGASGLGTIFELNADGTEGVLASFQGGSDGAIPFGGVIIGQSDLLYGTTYAGGGACNCGSIFKYNPLGGESVLHGFQGSDGEFPLAGLVMDASQNLYGTASQGGANGFGAVFKLDTNNNETLPYSFLGGSDGANPASGVTFDSKGNLFGTTVYGGGSACSGAGCGTVYELTPSLTETVLHAFQGDLVDGSFPVAGLTFDISGALFGSTCGSGQSPPNCNDFDSPGQHCARGCNMGDEFDVLPGNEVIPAAKFRVIHRFNGRSGSGPSTTLLLYHGTFYGTTEYGGAKGCKIGPEPGCGIVFSLTP